MKDKFCYFNGAILKFSEIKISPYDLGFVRGYGIFDAMKTANQIPFCLDEHWDKFSASAKYLNLNIPVDKSEFKEIIERLLEKNNFQEMALKTVLTGGESKNGFTQADKPTFLIIADELDSFKASKSLYELGCKVISCEYKRFLPKIKTLNYLEPLRIQSLRDDEGAQEIVYINNGNILECSTSNIFIIKNGVIITAYKDIFLGTTRNLVLKIAEKNNFKIEERVVKVEEFLSADEIFLTATYKKVIPVTKVDNRIIKEGKVGEITRQLMFLLDEFIENYS